MGKWPQDRAGEDQLKGSIRMSSFSKILLILWPLLPIGLAIFFHTKQNSRDAWTGGPISWPKSLWLSYTITTWFFCPILFLTAPQLSPALLLVFAFHLLSWWIRGPLELVMIYRWLNWSPRYGISHDLFHIAVTSFLLARSLAPPLAETASESGFTQVSMQLGQSAPLEMIATAFAIMIILTTAAEICFAFLFLKIRTAQEQSENVYFASDDPKWRFVNGATLAAVIAAYGHLLFQSAWLLYQPL
jgi:hypothetical protein